jgi:hypothetical protein
MRQEMASAMATVKNAPARLPPPAKGGGER